MKPFLLLLLPFLTFYSCTWKHEARTEILLIDTIGLEKPYKKSVIELTKSLILNKINIKDYVNLDSNQYKTITYLNIGYIFSKNQQHAIAGFLKNDTTFIIKLFVKNNNNWKSIFTDSINDYYAWKQDDIKLEDINNDKLPDIQVTKNVAFTGIGCFKSAWVWHKNTLVKVNNFDEIDNPVYDKSKNVIYSVSSSGGGAFLNFSTFKLIDYKTIKIESNYCGLEIQDDNIVKCKIVTTDNKSFLVDKKEAFKYVPVKDSAWVKQMYNN
ncbi:MAG: hypothetical protein RLZZ175_2807 [Bacteroidota bacterium]|jgi:hypothetical protein